MGRHNRRIHMRVHFSAYQVVVAKHPIVVQAMVMGCFGSREQLQSDWFAFLRGTQ